MSYIFVIVLILFAVTVISILRTPKSSKTNYGQWEYRDNGDWERVDDNNNEENKH